MDSTATSIGYTNVHDFTDAQTPPVTIIPSESQHQPPIPNSTRQTNTKRKEKEHAELTLQGYTPNTTHRATQETGRYRENAELPSRTLTKLPLRKSGLGIGPSTCGADAGYGLFASKDPTNKRQTTWVFAAGERIDIYRGHQLRPKKSKHGTKLSVQHQVRWLRSKYLWADTEDPDFVVDLHNPNSCYARYANDPLDDEKCNAKLKRIGNQVYLTATRDIYPNEEIFVAYGAAIQQGLSMEKTIQAQRNYNLSKLPPYMLESSSTAK